MRKLLGVLALVGSLAAAQVAVAAQRTVVFAVDNMTCASCPYTVKNSMAAVPGVLQVEVSFEAKTATVTFDDAVATPDAIAEASTNAGYPARPAGQGS